MREKLGVLCIVGLAAALAFPLVSFTAGCAGKQHRAVNVANGEYYSEDELIELPDGDKNRYCGELESQRAAVQQQLEALSAELAETEQKLAAARSNRDKLDRDLLALDSDLRTMDDQMTEIRALPTVWKARQGETLQVIAALPEIYNDAEKWWKIFEANEDKILDPFLAIPDTVLVIPRNWPTN